ncbi:MULTISPECIES: gas vesicle protein [Nocardia]|uniref:Gas vesicle protein n=1 Tax=Nocardia implantans TaxID=3108168 RepID=A0ABU6B3Q0_9NOCA|nr:MULTISPECIES: gas vesicle protein [unclassified Nocardia]MBF6194823.1 gas vesicle protein [Nocardia beijingensis]MEA3530519.1 gas vesicle protein [Nocardia sp. CDC192]MEB3514207.1 gas vesicle protein [Nocardia sp. CDC186]
MTVAPGGSSAPQPLGGHSSTNLADILERVLDKGLVIAGDIQVNLLDIELLTIKLRLVIASLETAKAVGIDWWETDPWLNSKARTLERQDRDLELENQKLRDRIAELESAKRQPQPIERRRQPREERS